MALRYHYFTITPKIFLTVSYWHWAEQSARLDQTGLLTALSVTNSASRPTLSPRCGISFTSSGTKLMVFLRGVTNEELISRVSDVMGFETETPITTKQCILWNKSPKYKKNQVLFHFLFLSSFFHPLVSHKSLKKLITTYWFDINLPSDGSMKVTKFRY